MLISYLPSPSPEFTRQLVLFSQDQKQLADIESRLAFKMFAPFQLKSVEKSPDGAGFVSIWCFPRSEKGILRLFRCAYAENLPPAPLKRLNAKLDKRSKVERRLQNQRERRKTARETREKIKQLRIHSEKERIRAEKQHRDRQCFLRWQARQGSYHYTKLLSAARATRSTDT
jgi:hypothetical protein